jgi:hypothetical protein
MEKIIISHRGNLNGSNPDKENKPHQVMTAIDMGLDVEVDLWHLPKGLFLGHDEPKYKIDYSFLVNKHLWLHCKNAEALVFHFQDKQLNLFFHKDDVAITSQGYLWVAPGGLLGYRSIACMPELSDSWSIKDACGVCTDYPLLYKDPSKWI